MAQGGLGIDHHGIEFILTRLLTTRYGCSIYAPCAGRRTQDAGTPFFIACLSDQVLDLAIVLLHHQDPVVVPAEKVSGCLQNVIVCHHTICRALSISSHSNRFDEIPVADAMQLRSTRNESYTPSCVGSIASPVERLRPTMLPSACSSCRAATAEWSAHVPSCYLLHVHES